MREVYEQISWSNDHQLEGWEGRTTRQWKAHPADMWHGEAEYMALPEEVRAALAPIVAQEGFSRVAKLSRREVGAGARRPGDAAGSCDKLDLRHRPRGCKGVPKR